MGLERVQLVGSSAQRMTSPSLDRCPVQIPQEVPVATRRYQRQQPVKRGDGQAAGGWSTHGLQQQGMYCVPARDVLHAGRQSGTDTWKCTYPRRRALDVFDVDDVVEGGHCCQKDRSQNGRQKWCAQGPYV
jgi:hypothetical protein